MTVDEKRYLDKCRKVPIKKAIEPRDGLTMIHSDSWWIVVDDCILYHGHGTPQCPCNAKLARGIKDRLCPSADLKHIRFVFEPTTPEKWMC